MNQMIEKMPKIDLHCHLDGSMSPEVIRKLLAERGEQYALEELTELLAAPSDCSSLAEYLKRFDLPIRCLQTKEGLETAAYDLARQAAEENVVYLEVRFAPSFSTLEGLSVCEILESVRNGLKKAEKSYGIYSGIIVCGMRNLDMMVNLQMLKEAEKFLGDGVVACDLAGDEKAYPTSDFRAFFEAAKKYHMPFTIHSGECGSVENVHEAVELGAKRLGHGIAMCKDIELMKFCAKHRIGVELCPSSNLQTKAVTSWKEYPFLQFFTQGIPISLNTDNRTVSRTSCTREIQLMEKQFALTQEDLKKIYLDSVEMSFAEEHRKEELRKIVIVSV